MQSFLMPPPSLLRNAPYPSNPHQGVPAPRGQPEGAILAHTPGLYIPSRIQFTPDRPSLTSSDETRADPGRGTATGASAVMENPG